MAFDGIIFDFNGVLWWDRHIQEASWNLFSKKRRRRYITKDEFLKNIQGRTNRDALEYLEGRPLNESDLISLIDEKESLYRTLCREERENFKLSPGAADLLDNLLISKIPMAIATSSEKSNLDFFVKSLSLTRWFDQKNLIYDDGTKPGKPAPDIYLTAVAKLNLYPSKCVVVEDSIVGIKSAARANIGCLIALVPDGDGHDAFLRAGAHRVINNLGQLSVEELFM